MSRSVANPLGIHNPVGGRKTPTTLHEEQKPVSEMAKKAARRIEPKRREL